MFITRNLIGATFRASARSSLLHATNTGLKISTTTAPHVLSSISIRTYIPRRGATSRKPTKLREPTAEKTSQADLVQQQEQQAQQVAGQQQQANSPYYDYQTVYGGRTAGQLIDENVSLQSFLKRSMLTTAAGIGGSAVACAAFIQLPFVAAHPYITLGVGALGAIGSMIAMNYNPPTYVQEGQILKAVNSPARQALFGTFLVAEGLSLAPMMKLVATVAPMAIPVAGAMALATMAAMGAYALKQPQGSLQKWGPALYVGLFGLIGAGLVNMFLHSSVLTMISSMGGIVIFSLFTAWDTHQAIHAHNEGHPDHLNVAVDFYLNFVNLFLDYLHLILGYFTSD